MSDVQDYYARMAFSVAELKAIHQRSTILMCMPNQHAALMKSYDDLRRISENLLVEVEHFEREKKVAQGVKDGKESSDQRGDTATRESPGEASEYHNARRAAVYS